MSTRSAPLEVLVEESLWEQKTQNNEVGPISMNAIHMFPKMVSVQEPEACVGASH
jgi:hypothetical protein